MRAARLLRLILILQNRGRLTAQALARELEVSRRTILRDVDAMTEAGLPVLVQRGPGGGIELGFGYRIRPTGLDRDEAEALAVLFARPPREAEALGLGAAALRAAAKLVAGLPEPVRATIAATEARVVVDAASEPADARIAALADAIRRGAEATLGLRGPAPRRLRPATIGRDAADWWIAATDGIRIRRADWGDVAISRQGVATRDRSAS